MNLKAKHKVKFRTFAICGKATTSHEPWILPAIIRGFPEEPAVKYIYSTLKNNESK